MVHVATPRPSIGGALGQALGAYGGNEFSYQRERGRTLQALQQARQNASQAQTPSDLLFSLLEATAGRPGAEKSLGPLFQQLMQQNMFKMQANVPPPGGGASGMQGPTQGQVPTQGNIPQGQQNVPKSSAQNTIPDWVPQPTGLAFEGANEPTALGLGPIPNIYTPDEIRQAEQGAASRGLDPSGISQLMENYNTRSRAQAQDKVNAAQTQNVISQARANRQQEFREVLTKELGKGISEDDFAVAEKIADKPEIRKIPNDKLRANATKKQFDIYQNAKNNFQTEADRVNFDESALKRQDQGLSQSARTLVKNGQMDLAERILSEGGRGPVEVANILNPLSQQTTSTIQKLPEVPGVLENVRALPDTDEFEKEFTKSQSQRSKVLGRYEDILKKEIKPGTVDKEGNIVPGTSLLSLRDEFLKKGVSWQEFYEMINRLSANGEIELDPYQQSKKPLLGEHPIRALGIKELLLRALPTYVERR